MNTDISRQNVEVGENEADFISKNEVGSQENSDSINDDSIQTDLDISDIKEFDVERTAKVAETQIIDSHSNDTDSPREVRDDLLPSTNKNIFTIYSKTMLLDEKDLSECSEALSSFSEGIHESTEGSTCEEIECDEPVSSALKFISPVKKRYKSMNGVIDEHFENRSLSKTAKEVKQNEILKALEKNDINGLKKAALSPGGLLSDNIRRKVWPKLVGVDLVAASPRPCQKEIEEHPYYQQVVLDVNRSLKRFPPSIEEAQRLTMLDQLVILIMRVLCKHPELHYYQGYHDICVTFLLVLGEETAYHVVEKLSTTHLSVFMEKSMESTIHLLEHMFLLIDKQLPRYKHFLMKSEVGVAYCLSWLITWFSHVLNDYGTVVRFFDFFIVSHSWMPLYVTTSLVLHREPEVIKQDCDMASVHSFLSKIPDDLPFEALLTESLDLFESCKPKVLARERPYVQKYKPKRVKRSYWSKLKFVPTTLVIAAAVLVTAVIYQAFNYTEIKG